MHLWWYMHQYAIVEMPTSTGTYGGGGSYLSVNYPSIEDSSVEFSLSQLWVVAGRYNDSSVNTAEVGWQVEDSNSVAPKMSIP